MITRSQAQKQTSTPRSSNNSSYQSFSENSTPEHSPGKTFNLSQSRLSDETPPLDFEDSVDSNLYFSSFFSSLEEMSTLDASLALKLIPIFGGHSDQLLKLERCAKLYIRRQQCHCNIW
jgi:hypothetical protein